MIILTRLGCKLPIAINPDLIERAEHTPDTVVTLVDGHKLVVEEPLEDVVALVRNWRASVAAEALSLAHLSYQAVEVGNENLHSGDVEDAVAADDAAHGTLGGRVLRLPVREV